MKRREEKSGIVKRLSKHTYVPQMDTKMCLDMFLDWFLEVCGRTRLYIVIRGKEELTTLQKMPFFHKKGPCGVMSYLTADSENHCHIIACDGQNGPKLNVFLRTTSTHDSL